ncbi:hypothetical protein [Pseudomonas aeruginosa]|uniref:hypothetical protein n=1 Tax=Pseudomonas aeruginosa TaxID=287 RepID=UPI00216301EC|nr:hypothetical protein [Pseudomonas aeruginosa]
MMIMQRFPYTNSSGCTAPSAKTLSRGVVAIGSSPSQPSGQVPAAISSRMRAFLGVDQVDARATEAVGCGVALGLDGQYALQAQQAGLQQDRSHALGVRGDAAVLQPLDAGLAQAVLGLAQLAP